MNKPLNTLPTYTNPTTAKQTFNAPKAKATAKPTTAAKGAVKRINQYACDIRIHPDKIERITSKGKAAQIPANALRLAQKTLCMVRPSFSNRMKDYVADYVQVEVEKADKAHVFAYDSYGNLHVRIQDKNGRVPPIMFTAHCDTVHSSTLPQGTQTVAYDATQQMFFKDDGECLGADDGTGIELMLGMIRAGVAGHYAFFLDEEKGRVGSNDYHKSDLFKEQTFEMCISFDRANMTDVIGSQSCGNCCSLEFGEALATQLTELTKYTYKPEAKGTFTDSATFYRDISECTNVSVGYKYQHGGAEQQDVKAFEALYAALPKVNWLKLPVKRDPTTIPEPKTYYSYSSYGGRRNYYTDDFWDESYHDQPFTRPKTTTKPKQEKTLEDYSYDDFSIWEQMATPNGRRYEDTYDFLKTYPALASKALEYMGIEVDDLEEAINEIAQWKE